MEQTLLCNLKEGDTFQDGFLLVRTISERMSQAGKPYCDMLLTDRESEISAKLWDANKTNVQQGMIVKVRGVVVTWQGKMQLNVEKIRPVTDQDEVDYAAIVPSAPRSGEDMLAELYEYCHSIADDGFRSIAEAVIDEKKDVLIYAPGAKANHHSERGGLLHHTLTMLQGAEAMCGIYPILNRDMLIAGCILHDMCKLEEMNSSELGIVSDYTTRGNLMGHLVLGAMQIARIADRLGVDEDRAMVLEHMILSHHGEPELGSVRVPMFPEAEMLHHLDIIDARMFDYERVLKRVPEDEFSEWNRLLDRRLYKHKFSKI